MLCSLIAPIAEKAAKKQTRRYIRPVTAAVRGSRSAALHRVVTTAGAVTELAVCRAGAHCVLGVVLTVSLSPFFSERAAAAAASDKLLAFQTARNKNKEWLERHRVATAS